VFPAKKGQPSRFPAEHAELGSLLAPEEYNAARLNTVNAHYTDTAIAQAMWDGLARFGFTGGRVFEPGCGSGNFIGLAPLGTAMVGVELDPVTARISAAMYPHAQIRPENFKDTRLPEGSFDAAIGNVPFGKIHLKDPKYNPGRRDPIHTYFIRKSAALVRPGGLLALITSRYTMDGEGRDAVAARRELASVGELLAAVRLPESAHRRTAGTGVVTDVLFLRRFEEGEPVPVSDPAWVGTVPVQAGQFQIPVNRYFADHPDMVLGEFADGGSYRKNDLTVIAPPGTDAAGELADAVRRAAEARTVATSPRPVLAASSERLIEGFLQAHRDGRFTRITDGSEEPFEPGGGTAGREELRALLGIRDAALDLLDAECSTADDAGLVDDLRARLNSRYDGYVAAYGAVGRYNPQVKVPGRQLRERLLAVGHARFAGGTADIADPVLEERLIEDGHALRHEAAGAFTWRRTRAAREERERLIGAGHAVRRGGTFQLTDEGRSWILENLADLGDSVTVSKKRPQQGGFRADPHFHRVLALEKYDPETGTASKQDIMRHRVLLPRPVIARAESPADALAVCMDRHAEVRLDVIADLLGAESEEHAREQLGLLVYHDPAEGVLVPAPAYLSGDIRKKLREAEAAAAEDLAYQVNVDALRAAVPEDAGPDMIDARVGAVFITPEETLQFLREILGDQSVTLARGDDGKWHVRGDKSSNAARIIWGTQKADALYLAENLLNRGKPVQVTWTDAEGKRHVDEDATAEARDKQAELADRFAGWAWEDMDRAAEVCRRFNEMFRSEVLRSYDDVHLSLPGVNRDITLNWWQETAIARMIYEPSAGLYHDMGAGKTLEMIIGLMEQRRLGLIRKPVIVVKNSLLEQFRDEFIWAYPRARILCADTSDLAGDGRRAFIARCAAETPDAIIMTRGAYQSIPLTAEGYEAYITHIKGIFEAYVEAVSDSVKDQATMLAEFEERLRSYFDPDYQDDEEDEDEEEGEAARPKERKRKIEQDPAMCWEHLGVDYIGDDEAQDHNNLWTPSDEPGLAIDFVFRSVDHEAKLLATRRRYGNRAAAETTGTPVTNKITQFHVLQRRMRPERLTELGFDSFTTWAATFTETEQRLEMKADGTFGTVTRMRLINVPELLKELHYFGDFKDADTIGLERPAVRGGKPEICPVPPTQALMDYQATLPARYRAAKIGKRHKGDDTVPAVIGDGFRAAQDLRLVKGRHGVQPDLTDEPQKIHYVADDVFAEWQAHRDREYLDDSGQPSPVKGGLQLVFCNEGVPKRGEWNLYDELRDLLTAKGMPRHTIRFIHEAGDSRKKKELFAACRNGHVAVLIGSTEKMGVGVNVQARCIGVHHVHPHWRPDYDEQEDARARRPHNQNAEVFIKRWITETSFDTIRAQACERKAIFLRAVKHPDPNVRSIEAPPDDEVSYAQISAIGAGEPRLMLKAELTSKLQQLARRQRRHANSQNALKVSRQQAYAAVAAAEQAIRDVDAAAARAVPVSGSEFCMTVDGTLHEDRAGAGDHLRSFLKDTQAHLPAWGRQTAAVGMLGGLEVTAALYRDTRSEDIVLTVGDLPGTAIPLNHADLPTGRGLLTRLVNKITGLDALRADLQDRIVKQQQEAARAEAAIGAPFPQQQELLDTKKALDALIADLSKSRQPDAAGQAPASGAAAVPGGPAAPGRTGAAQVPGKPVPEPASPPPEAVSPAVSGYDAARANALITIGGVPDAEQFADYFARTYGSADPGQQPLAAQVYADEWLPRQPDDHPLKQTGYQPQGTPSVAADGSRTSRDAAQAAPGLASATPEDSSGQTTPTDATASLPSWTSGSPYSVAITASCQAALSDSHVAQVARASSLDRFMEWLLNSGWVLDHAAAAVGDDGQVPPFARAVLDDPVFGVDAACAIGPVVHSAFTGQSLPSWAAEFRPVPPRAELAAVGYWGEQDEATGQAAVGDGWQDLVIAARIDIWLSRAGLPREGRKVRWNSGGHAELELAVGGEQWRLQIPRRQDAPYRLTRPGRDDWSRTLDGTSGSTTQEQAASLLTGILAQETGIPTWDGTSTLNPATTGTRQQDVPRPGADPAGSSDGTTPQAGDTAGETVPESGADPSQQDDSKPRGEAADGPGDQYAPQLDAMVAAALADRSVTRIALMNWPDYEIAFGRWAREYLAAVTAAALQPADTVSETIPGWAQALHGDHDLAASLTAAAARRAAVHVAADAAARQAAQPDDEAPVVRTAVIQRTSSGWPSAEQVRAYLPRLYHVTGSTADTITVTGRDVAGWTMDDYVITRLGTGMITAREARGRPARPYQDRGKADEGRQAITDAWHAWQQHAPAASRGPAEQQLHAVLNAAVARPDLDEHGTGHNWTDAAASAVLALDETGAEQPGDGPLAALARAIGVHAARLSAGQPPAGPPVVPYPGAGEYLAGAATLMAARATWHESPTGSTLRKLTDREARGNHLYDTRHAARDVIDRLFLLSQSGKSGDPGLAQTARNSAAAAAACHRLQLTLRAGDYADPADRQLLLDMTLAAAVHAARVRAAVDAGQAAAIADALPAATAALTAAAGARRRQDGDQGSRQRAGASRTDAAAGLVLEHGDGGTRLLGVTGSLDDGSLRAQIKELGFKPSRDRSYWYLPRPWKRPTRDRRVRQFRQALKDMSRSCDERDYRPAWENDDPGTPPIEPGEPYPSGTQAMQGIRTITDAYYQVTRTPAGERMFYPATGGMRADAADLKAAITALRNPSSTEAQRSVSGLADLVTRVASASDALHRHLVIDKQKGDVFLPRLKALTGTARETAGRLAATSAVLAERGMTTIGDAAPEAQPAGPGMPSETPDQSRVQPSGPAGDEEENEAAPGKAGMLDALAANGNLIIARVGASGTDRDGTGPGGQAPAPPDTGQRAEDEHPLARGKPDPARRRDHRMNDVDIEQAAERWTGHPLLGPACRTLARLQRWTDFESRSDGWMTWPPPMRAAQALMELIERDGSRRYREDPVRADVTAQELERAYTPLKSFRTKVNGEFEIEEVAVSASGARQRQPGLAAGRGSGASGKPASHPQGQDPKAGTGPDPAGSTAPQQHAPDPGEPVHWDHALTMTGGIYLATVGGHGIHIAHSKDGTIRTVSIDRHDAGMSAAGLTLKDTQAQAVARARTLAPVQRPAREETGNVLSPAQAASAYRAVHGEPAPRWQENGTPPDGVQAEPWYQAALAAKRDDWPMTAVPRYMAATVLNAGADRLLDADAAPAFAGHDPGEARAVALALQDASRAVQAGDVSEALTAINEARAEISPVSGLREVLDRHETAITDLSGPLPPVQPGAEPDLLESLQAAPGREDQRGKDSAGKNTAGGATERNSSSPSAPGTVQPQDTGPARTEAAPAGPGGDPQAVPAGIRQYSPQLRTMVEAALADPALAGAARNGDQRNFEITFRSWSRAYLARVATAEVQESMASSVAVPEWARRLIDDDGLVSALTATAAVRVRTQAPAAAREASRARDHGQPAHDEGSRVPAASAGAPAAPVIVGALGDGRRPVTRAGVNCGWLRWQGEVLGQFDLSGNRIGTLYRSDGKRAADGTVTHTWRADLAAERFADRTEVIRRASLEQAAAAVLNATAQQGSPPAEDGPAPAVTAGPTIAGTTAEDPDDASTGTSAPHGAAARGRTSQPGGAERPAPGLARRLAVITGSGDDPDTDPPVPQVTVLTNAVSRATGYSVQARWDGRDCTEVYWVHKPGGKFAGSSVVMRHRRFRGAAPDQREKQREASNHADLVILYTDGIDHDGNGTEKLGHHLVRFYGPSPALDAMIRASGAYEQLTPEDRERYDGFIEYARAGKTRAGKISKWNELLQWLASRAADGDLPSDAEAQAADVIGPADGELYRIACRVVRHYTAEGITPPAAYASPVNGDATAVSPTASDATAVESSSTSAATGRPSSPEAWSLHPVEEAGGAAAQNAARLGQTFYVHRVPATGSLDRCMVSASMPPLTSGYLSVTPAGEWAEHWRGETRPLEAAGGAPAPGYPFTLAEARELAAATRLSVVITRVGDRAFVSLAEPAAATVPLLCFEARSRDVFAGRRMVTPGQAVEWLGKYRTAADALAGKAGGSAYEADPGIDEWPQRIAQLAPHLVPVCRGDFRKPIAGNLANVVEWARQGHREHAEGMLISTERNADPLVMSPAREAAFVRKITENVPWLIQSQAPDLTRSIADLELMDPDVRPTAREITWIRNYIDSHREDLASGPGVGITEQLAAAEAQRKRDTEAARNLFGQMKKAIADRRYPAALALLEDAELRAVGMSIPAMDFTSARAEITGSTVIMTSAAGTGVPAPSAQEHGLPEPVKWERPENGSGLRAELDGHRMTVFPGSRGFPCAVIVDGKRIGAHKDEELAKALAVRHVRALLRDSSGDGPAAGPGTPSASTSPAAGKPAAAETLEDSGGSLADPVPAGENGQREDGPVPAADPGGKRALSADDEGAGATAEGAAPAQQQPGPAVAAIGVTDTVVPPPAEPAWDEDRLMMCLSAAQAAGLRARPFQSGSAPDPLDSLARDLLTDMARSLYARIPGSRPLPDAAVQGAGCKRYCPCGAVFAAHSDGGSQIIFSLENGPVGRIPNASGAAGGDPCPECGEPLADTVADPRDPDLPPEIAKTAETAAWLTRRGLIEPAGNALDSLVGDTILLTVFAHPDVRSTSGLADLWEDEWRKAYELSLPSWECPCGCRYKTTEPLKVPLRGQSPRYQLYAEAGGGLLGDPVASVVLGQSQDKGTAKGGGQDDRAACPGCGRAFAAMITRHLVERDWTVVKPGTRAPGGGPAGSGDRPAAGDQPVPAGAHSTDPAAALEALPARNAAALLLDAVQDDVSGELQHAAEWARTSLSPEMQAVLRKGFDLAKQASAAAAACAGRPSAAAFAALANGLDSVLGRGVGYVTLSARRHAGRRPAARGPRARVTARAGASASRGPARR
jgi:N12 class adenine-specific DNA methylase